MKEIQAGMTADQVSETIMGNFSEVSAEADRAKTMAAAEEARAKGAEQDLTEAVAQNVGDITVLKENSATKAELNAEAERAQSAEELISQQAEQNFRNFSELGVSESSKIDGYEIALTKKTNTAEKTKVKVPVYDMQNPSATPVGLVDEIFVEDMKAEAKKMVDAEAERAKAAEGEIRGSVESLGEDLNAASEDISKLEVAIEAEKSRAKEAEQALSVEITEAENRVDERVTEVRDGLEAEVQARSADVADLNANTGISEYPVFDAAVDYAVGDVVKYEGRLYRFTAEHAQGEWIGTDVEKWSERKEKEEEESLATGSKEWFTKEWYYVNAGTGQILPTETTGSVVTDYINLEGVESFIVKNGRATSHVALFAYYNSKKIFISSYNIRENAIVRSKDFPEDAAFVVFTGIKALTNLNIYTLYTLKKDIEKIKIRAIEDKEILSSQITNTLLGSLSGLKVSQYYVANGESLSKHDNNASLAYRSFIVYLPPKVNRVIVRNAITVTNLYYTHERPDAGVLLEGKAAVVTDGTTKIYTLPSNDNGVYVIIGLNITLGDISEIEIEAPWIEEMSEMRTEISDISKEIHTEISEDISDKIDNQEARVVYKSNTVGAEYELSTYSGMKGIVIDVVKGETYYITGRGGNTYRLWAIASDGIIIRNQAYTSSNEQATIECDGTFNQIVVNVVYNENYSIVKRYPKTLKDRVIKLEDYTEKLGGSTKNKKVILLGDSQVGQDTKFEELLNEMLPITAYNCGFAGCRMALRTDDASSPYDAFSATAVTDAIVSRDFTAMDRALATLQSEGSYYYTLFAPRVETLKGVNLGDGDNCIMTIAYGSNDYSGGNDIGEASTLDKRTLLGAMQYVIETLLKAYPKLQLIFVGMPYRVYSHEGNDIISDSNDYVASNGFHRYDYSDAILNNAKANQLPCFDMYRRCGRNKYNIFTICPDGTHPTSAYGQKLTAELYCKMLQSF